MNNDDREAIKKIVETSFAEGNNFAKYIINHAKKMGVTDEELIIGLSIIVTNIARSSPTGFLSGFMFLLDFNDVITALVNKPENMEIMKSQAKFLEKLKGKDLAMINETMCSVGKILKDNSGD